MSNWTQSSSSSSDPHIDLTEDSVPSTSTPAGFCLSCLYPHFFIHEDGSHGLDLLSVRWITKPTRRESLEVSAGVEQAARAQEKHERNSKEGQQPYSSPSMQLPYHKQMSPVRTHNCMLSALVEEIFSFQYRCPTVYRSIVSPL